MLNTLRKWARYSKLYYFKKRLNVIFNPVWYKYAVGGRWNEMGKLQFDFMLKQGLKPEHYFLDVGCGSLRGGLHFIGYLDPWHYWGVDHNRALLKTGKKLILQNGLGYKKPFLTYLDNFKFDTDCVKVDFALAQSVFTHLRIEQIRTCIKNIKSVLKGKFYATFFEKEDFTQINYDTFAYPFKFFQDICFENRLNIEYIGEWKHPWGQKMMVIFKGGENV